MKGNILTFSSDWDAKVHALSFRLCPPLFHPDTLSGFAITLRLYWIASELEESEDEQAQKDVRICNHFLIEIEGPKSTTRRRCTQCYKSLSKEYGRFHAQRFSKKVVTKCDTCNVYYCLRCLNKIHGHLCPVITATEVVN